MSVDTSGFYKCEVSPKGADRNVLLTGKVLENKDWTLTVDNKDSFTLPHDGWQYYNSIEEACTAHSLDVEKWSYYLFGIGDEPV
jgi:hypothetical protein